MRLTPAEREAMVDELKRLEEAEAEATRAKLRGGPLGGLDGHLRWERICDLRRLRYLDDLANGKVL